jgi:uncharacterized protein
MSDTHGAIWWSELMTRDVAAARDYYAAICGWSFEDMPMDGGEDYHCAMKAGRPTAGIMDMTGLTGMDETPPHWFTYIAVDDVDAAAQATEAAGGTIIRPPFDVPGVGRIVIVTDPAGAAVGLMTPAAMG